MIIFLNAFWQNGLPFGIALGLVYGYLNGWEHGLNYGAFGEFVFGLYMAIIVYLKTRKFTQHRPLAPDERLIEECPAKYLDKKGWLYLTSARLLFVTDQITITGHELSIPLSEIVSAERGFTIGILPDKLILNLTNGEHDELFVQTPKTLVNQIKRASKLLTAPSRKLSIYD